MGTMARKQGPSQLRTQPGNGRARTRTQASGRPAGKGLWVGAKYCSELEAKEEAPWEPPPPWPGP